MKMRIKPVIVDVVEDDGMWLDKSTMTYYNKDSLEPAEWSEEDEEGFNCVANCLSSFYILTDDVAQRDKIDSAEMWLNNRLKSLRPNHWKPSEEQMKSINTALVNLPLYGNSFCALKSLYNDLKKL